MEQSKQCSKCYVVKPLSKFSRQKGGLYGRLSICKVCQVIANKKYRHNRKANQQIQYMDCWKCEKPLDQDRLIAELRRMKNEGFGAKLPACKDCT